MKHIILTWVAVISLGLSGSAMAETAADIMKKVDERYTGDTSNSEATLVLIDKRDRQRVRELSMFSSENTEVEKSIIFFRSPSDVKNTSYMAYDWSDESKEDDSWLYLPALKKVRRVAASDESGAFMGSDFSYADINGTDYEDFDYTLENVSDPVEGFDCWVIKSTPKNRSVIKETGYSESISWVRKDSYMMVKSIIQVKKGKRTKYFSAKDIEKIQGVWTAKTLQMVTTRQGAREHSSVFKIQNIQYNKGVDETLFDTQAMQRGI
ncbi:outer membrane lipoprotein-sorting protein [Teredinibacter haidensis]|uniref:outer membrane lipoprotein-sorting protein n=1 Tax=Teredinibacter haidensis TaxID=2731755 RepID=UPI0009F83582|nr:outer membrane lipoprotein-sorting protein [Teredinibacter haidensis]